MSTTSFPGQASCQGLAILARWCHPSMRLLPALGQPSRVEEEEEEEGTSQHPVSLQALQGCLGHPWSCSSQPQHIHRHSGALVPPSQAPGQDPGGHHPGLLGNKAPLPAVLPGAWLVLPMVPSGAGAATSLPDAASPAGSCRSGWILAVHMMPRSGQQLP